MLPVLRGSRQIVAMYRLLYQATTGALQRVPFGSGKLAASIAGRRGAATRWAEWAAVRRGTGPVLWVHGASVGEVAAIEPVIRRLQSAQPGLRFVLSFSSPSMASWARPTWADQADYVPLDQPAAIGKALTAVDPAALLFSRGDLWPELVAGALDREIPVAVIGATVRQHSLRLRWPTRALTSRLYRGLSYVGAVSAGDAARWRQLGAQACVVEAIGDPRHDAVLERVQSSWHPGVGPLASWARRGPVMVAGSVEPSDQGPLIDAYASVASSHEGTRLVIVPHDPSLPMVSRISGYLEERLLPFESWCPEAGGSTPSASCVLVVARGLLADLYRLGSMAYVGGGFRPRGLHAVIEPAACTLPLIVGPHWRGISDAEGLVASGGAVAVGNADQLAEHWRGWLDRADQRSVAGRVAYGMLRSGASAAAVNAIQPLLQTSPIGAPPTRR